MSTEDWGQCKSCKWWQIEPDAQIQDTTAGICIEEKLLPYLLRVSGNSGCNRYAEGKPVRAAGSADKPPSAKPQR